MRIPMVPLRSKQHLPPSPRPTPSAVPCLLCGRWVLDPNKATWVHYATGGELLIDEDDAPDSQGGFPLGPDCARRFRRAVRIARSVEHVAGEAAHPNQ
jgi:hypothetical protein